MRIISTIEFKSMRVISSEMDCVAAKPKVFISKVITFYTLNNLLPATPLAFISISAIIFIRINIANALSH